MRVISQQGPWYLRRGKLSVVLLGTLFLLAVSSLVMWHTNIVNAATLQEGIVAHWKMDESSPGATVIDSGSNGYNGTPIGNGDGSPLPQPSTNVPTVDFADPYSLSFDGDDDAVTTNFSLNGMSQYTAAGWIHPKSAGNRISFFGQNDTLEFGFSDSTHIACYTGNSGSSATISWQFNSTTFPLNQWHHVACTNTGSAQVLYIDGVAVATGTASVGVGNAAEKFTLGAGAWDVTGGNFNGMLDDVHVYNRALTASEITQLQSTSSEEIVLTLQGGSNVTNEIGSSAAITDLQVTASMGNPSVPVKLLVSNGTLSMSTKTGLTFYTAVGATGGPQSGSTLYFSGTLSNVNSALATLSYTRTSGVGTDTVEASLVSPGEVFFPSTNHLYEYVSVPGNITWTNAKTAAEARTKYGAQGYLTTIASQAENNFVAERLLNAGWMGASDSAVEGTWRWVTGPENGTTFSTGNVNPVTAVGQYANWNNGEPNDTGGEDCGQFLAGGTGRWNDLPCGSTLPGYVVEYGAPGDMPTVSAKNITVTTSDTTAPSLAGTVTIPSSPTADATPSLSWNTATDSGVGLANPAYRLQWSSSATFAGYSQSGSNSMTSNTTSATLASNLSNGTWYFRVVATDQAGNARTSAVSSALVVDTVSPTITSLSPADNVTNAAVNAQLIIVFDEAIQKSAGSVVIRRVSNNTIVETVNVSSSSVAITGSTATVTLSSSLDNNTDYYVQVSAGAFEDLAGNDFAGITGTTAWNFTTVKTPLQIALEKIQTYADTDGASAALTLVDFTDAGITGVTVENLANTNASIATSDPADVTNQSSIQTIANRAAAFTVIQRYATSRGTTTTPTVNDYAVAGVTGVNSSNLAAVNAAVAASDPAQSVSFAQLQSFISAAITRAEQAALLAPNTGLAKESKYLGIAAVGLLMSVGVFILCGLFVRAHLK